MGTRKSAAELISEEEAKKIFNYFSLHTVASTIKKFELSRSAFTILCSKYGVPFHSSSVSETLKHVEMDGYDQYSEAEIENIYTTYNEHEDVVITSSICGVKEYFVVYLLKLKNITPKYNYINNVHWRDDLTDFDIENIIKFYIFPNTLVDTAENFNLSVDNIKSILDEQHIERHSRGITETLGKAKQRRRLNEKFGVDNVFQLEKVKEKAKATKLEKYGDENFVNVEQRKKTCLEKYGSECFLGSEQGQNAVKQYNRNRFGVDYAFQSGDWQNNSEYREKRLKTIHDNKYTSENYSEKFLELCDDPAALLEFVKGKTIADVANDLDITHDNAYYLLFKYGLLEYAEPSAGRSSQYENEIMEYIGKDICIHKDRQILNGKEIDILIPDKNIGIEFNGTYWHSSAKIGNRNYHLNKSKMASDQGIRLIHIFEYEWKDEKLRSKIKLMLDTALGRVQKKIYARQCEIKVISNKEARELNEKIHLQGHRNAQVTYGLFFKGELVQLMSFSRSKYNKNLKSDNSWEIIRGCPGSNNIVVGGVSKLFKHFIRDVNPEYVFSYCDFNKFDGKSYEAIGMKFVGYTGPDMKWVLRNGKVVNRQPSKHSELKGQSVAQIYGAGSKKYLWKRDV